VLFDEPFTGLDDHAVRVIADRLRRLAAAAPSCCWRRTIWIWPTAVALIRDGRLLSDEPASRGSRARYRALIGAH
jgi:energy-coupling factor transporter ATP-binding protein EcfA2